MIVRTPSHSWRSSPPLAHSIAQTCTGTAQTLHRHCADTAQTLHRRTHTSHVAPRTGKASSLRDDGPSSMSDHRNPKPGRPSVPQLNVQASKPAACASSSTSTEEDDLGQLTARAL